MSNIDPLEVLETLKTQAQDQNQLQGSILSAVRLGPPISSTIRLGLESLEDANSLIFQGLALNYEIKWVYKYRPRKRELTSQRPNRPKEYFQEASQETPKATHKALPTQEATQGPPETQEPSTQDTEMDLGDFIEVEPRRKRKAITSP